ncbi:sucrase ferredoxin [Arsenicicoccus piscis]|uniref:sucrase ferredoxin n=1 Tax=Arsenicicoccus piscis TaxID=673954 RepID=UPI001F4CCB01|nr:sucrase ferredoxin [Arsenicicoccus piscis]MCH8628606.1 sucrase ferredoxin [Arsenicicoccus piscis]
MTGRGSLPADACSIAWERSGLPVYGSAAQATFIVALEQPGPWGRDAIVQSHLDPEVGRAIEDACARAGGRFLLIRAPGAHSDIEHASPRRVFVSGGLAVGRPWLLVGTVVRPATLLELPFADLGAGGAFAARAVVPGHLTTTTGILLVCTNSKRDVCCAVRGRPIARAAAEQRPGRVWECTHTGGHRFAPTGVALPTGHTVANLTTELAVEIVDASARDELAAGALGPSHDRGRSCLPAPAQAAESFVRAETGETDPHAFRVRISMAGGILAHVTHTDGRSWLLRLELAPTGDERKDSCAKPATPSRAWTITSLPTGDSY